VQTGRVSVSVGGIMMNRLPSILSLILTVTAGGVLTGTASHAAQATLRCPGTVQTGAQLATEITLDVGAIPLGAYSLTVTSDPAVLAIESVAGGDSPEFAGAPTTNPGSVTSGTTNVSAFQTSSLNGPTGVVSVARIRFNVVGTIPTTTSIGLTGVHLFDTNSNSIPATATGCVVIIGGTAMTIPTTTSTTTTTIPRNACSVGRGSWKNHPSAWPVGTLMLGSQTYTQDELLALFDTPPGGDASVILAHQLIAAKLNVANGADPTPISATISDADRLLSGFTGKLPYHVPPSSATGQAMVNDADVLDSYNSGDLTPDCQP